MEQIRMRNQKKGKYQKQQKESNTIRSLIGCFAILGLCGVVSIVFFKAGEHSAPQKQTDTSAAIEHTIQTSDTVPESIEAIGVTETFPTVIEPPPTELTPQAEPTVPVAFETAPEALTGSVLRSAGQLNVRSGAGTAYDKVGQLTGGEIVTIYEQVDVNGTNWGNIGYGWVCMDYIVFGIDNSSPPNVSLDDVFYDIEPLLGVSRADYIGYWVGGSQNTWSLEITKTGNSVYISVERMDNSTDNTVWGMTGTFDNQAILCYSSGVCTSFVNGYSTLRYTTGEGTFVLRDGQMSWYERMEGNITFMTFTRAGAHTTAPSEQGNNQYTQPSQANGNQTTQNIPQRFHSDDLRKALEREVKIQLGYRNGDSFEIGYPWLLKYDLSTGKYYAAANGKWCGSDFYINAVLMDVNGVLTVSTVIECSVK